MPILVFKFHYIWNKTYATVYGNDHTWDCLQKTPMFLNIFDDHFPGNGPSLKDELLLSNAVENNTMNSFSWDFQIPLRNAKS